MRTFVILLIVLAMTACSTLPEETPTPAPTVDLSTSTPEPEPTSTPYIQEFPTANPDLLLFTTHIQALRVADDDGQNMANISPDEIIRLVNKANDIFAQAGIRILFDPQKDVDLVQSTVIANMLGKDDLHWQWEMDIADQIAAKYPGKLVIFFRQKTVEEPGRKGNFFWWDYNFTIVPIEGEKKCGSLDNTRLAHEIGHYLALGNTYTEEFPDLEMAVEAYKRSGYNLSAFDGDTFSDTPADIYIDTPENQCGTSDSITIEGGTIPVKRGNLMANYSPRSALTLMQIARMRYMLAMRYSNDMVVPHNRELQHGYELENITILEHRWSSSSVTDMTPYSSRNWSGGKQLSVLGGYGSGLLVEFSVDKDGVYLLNLYATQAPDYGVLEVEVDDILVNDYVDLYAPFIYASGAVGMGPYYLTKGPHQMLFKVIKKNDLSTGYNFGLDAITVEFQK